MDTFFDSFSDELEKIASSKKRRDFTKQKYREAVAKNPAIQLSVYDKPVPYRRGAEPKTLVELAREGMRELPPGRYGPRYAVNPFETAYPYDVSGSRGRRAQRALLSRYEKRGLKGLRPAERTEQGALSAYQRAARQERRARVMGNPGSADRFASLADKRTGRVAAARQVQQMEAAKPVNKAKRFVRKLLRK